MQIQFSLLVPRLLHMKLFTGFYDSYFGEKLLAENLGKTWNFVFIKASFKNKKDSRNLTTRVLFNPVRASQLLRIPRCVIIIVVVDGFDLTLVMST